MNLSDVTTSEFSLAPTFNFFIEVGLLTSNINHKHKIDFLTTSIKLMTCKNIYNNIFGGRFETFFEHCFTFFA